MQEKKLVPKLRFPEFEEEWESKKLLKLCTKISDGIHSTPKYTDNSKFYFINGNNLVNRKIEINEKTKTVSEKEYLKHKRELSSKTILLSINGTIGNLAYYNNEKVILGKSACYINLRENNSINYIFNLLQTNKIKNYFLSELTGSTIKNLSLSTIKETTINLPSLPEQEKIASFLSKVDEKIEKLERKKELWEEYKKGIMQKIFSREIRFRSDEGNEFCEWEEKRLGEVCSITTGKLDANAMIENGEYRFYTCAKEYFQIDKYAFDTEALLISGNGANVGYIHYYKGKFNAYQRTYVLDGFRENITYIKYFLDKSLKKRITQEKNEGNTPYIVLGTLRDMKIKLPSLPEQEKISNFLSNLDTKIDVLEREIERNKEFKRGLLQGLFV